MADFKYPQKLKVKQWENYLGRSLKFEERLLIELCRSEKHMNKMLDDLYKHILIKQKNYCVPLLTKLDGNCLFESLNYFKVGTNINELRTMLSTVFYIFKDYKNFLPGMETTLSELFSFTNEIEYVSTKDPKTKEKKYYKYSYEIMCQDLGNLTCWSRLPTQLILLVISYLFKVRIIITHSNTGHETIINAYESIKNININIKEIYLGLLGESHYIVLDISADFNKVYYTEARNNLNKFGSFIEHMKIKHHEEKNQLCLPKPTEFTEINIKDIEKCDDEVTF